MSKVKCHQCLGCFTVYDHKPETCCDKQHNEPFAIEGVSQKEHAEYLEAVREGWV